RVVRETSYLEKSCSVDGHMTREIPDLRTLRDYIRLLLLLNEFKRTWPRPVDFVPGHEVASAEIAGDLVAEVGNLLAVLQHCGEDPLPCIPGAQRADLCEANERQRWSNAIKAELARHTAQSYQEKLDEHREKIRSVLTQSNHHTCLQKLLEAVSRRDAHGWTDAWNDRNRIRVKLDEFNQYNELLGRLMEHSPQLVTTIRVGEGNPDWLSRFQQLHLAWYWSSARGWLEEVSGRDRHDM